MLDSAVGQRSSMPSCAPDLVGHPNFLLSDQRTPPPLMSNNRARLVSGHFVPNGSALGLDDIRGFNLDKYIPSIL
ncbi:hypothetical protein ALP68_101294 [Pseudomonas ficuserectae]|uniref:Uncharacterized protein n=3 Tax=Pseudomonas syringae group genomosp. 2 TaxID=251698 RepID=A0A3M4MPC4_PSESG|nr:hypothetical protein ALO62_101554 [Pseudomonas amygdali pv. myricae]KPY10461.1 hypothetical protein ALO55_101377 [Pseudomonas savastanoi pv. phaseolicola]RMM56309.1 hypothetical protein ALQ74_101506 [Pseudomonas savastanoi pv. glycinea]RMS33318.1 hypothetical protein ALP68_101294 [Pseudomonas ficuserectae]RMT13734.1 hypothetical protein ALP52_101280 [Pseudomonas amygdali pv. mori]